MLQGTPWAGLEKGEGRGERGEKTCDGRMGGERKRERERERGRGRKRDRERERGNVSVVVALAVGFRWSANQPTTSCKRDTLKARAIEKQKHTYLTVS